MKILLVNDYGTPTGGAEAMTLALRAGLRQRGHEARLFASRARPNGGASAADYECSGTTSRFRTLLQTANPWAFWQLRRALAEFRPDVVHVRLFLTQLSPLILPLLRDVPSLYHVPWYRPVCPLGTKLLPDDSPCQVRHGVVCYRNNCLPLRDWLPLMLQMQLWRRWRGAFDLNVAPSQALKNRLVAHDIAPVEVIPNGVPVQPLRPPLSDPPTVAFAGRLVREKGADVLLRAFARVVAQVPRAQLLLAGEGPERTRLERMIDDLGLSSNVNRSRSGRLGHLPRPEMERHFAAAWVQVVPSRWAEPFGLVAAEAMMRGTAVIASGSGGLAEIVRPGRTGLLVPPGDPNALAEALLQILADVDLSERLGRAGRKIAVAQYREATCVERFVQVYQALCRKSPSADGGDGG